MIQASARVVRLRGFAYLLGVAISVLATACHGDRNDRVVGDTSATRDSAATQSASVTLPSAPQPGWRTFEGDGFTLRYPPDAVVERGPAGVGDTATIRGPRIHVPVDPDAGPSDGPAYQLRVESFPNPASVTAEAWVDSIRTAANAHEMDPDSLGFLSPPDTVTFGSVRALRLEPFCGDCAPEELYLAAPRRRVLLSYVFDISYPGDRDAQRRLYEAIVSTFSWK